MVVLVGFFLFFTLAAEEFLVIGFILSSQLCLQFRYLGAELLKLSLALVSAVAAATSAAATTFLMHLPKLVPLHMGKLAVFIGPEIMFLNSAVFKLLLRWRLAPPGLPPNPFSLAAQLRHVLLSFGPSPPSGPMPSSET